MIKKIFLIVVVPALFLYVTPAQAAKSVAFQKVPKKTEVVVEKKNRREEMLVARKPIEAALRTTTKSAHEQFATDILAAKNLKGKSKAAAAKMAKIKRDVTIKSAKEIHRSALQSLSRKK